MKKLFVSGAVICMSLCTLTFSGCGNKNNAANSGNSATQLTTVAQSNVNSQLATEQNSTNSQITVTEVDTDTIKDEYLNNMTKEGVYSLNRDNEVVVVAVNPDGYEYDVDVRVNGSEVSVKYETEHSDDKGIQVDDDAYLIKNIDKNTVIKVYKDNQETSFVETISCDEIFK